MRSQLPRTDSRLQRYLRILDENKISYTVLGWNKRGEENFLDNQILYQKIVQVGGGISNLFSLFCWNFFLALQLFKLRKSYSAIHAVDFDTIIPSLLISKIFCKKLIFDVYDKYTDAREMPTWIAFVIDRIEWWGCISSDELILPDECRRVQLELPEWKIATVIENVPSSIDLNSLPFLDFFEFTNSRLVLSYVGILESKHRGLEDLLKVVSCNSDVLLNIAGDGSLREVVIDFSERFDNIEYHGIIAPEEALSIMYSSHVIVGMYYKTISNHNFASPNKYYEHLMLGRALLTTKGTPPGNKVELHSTGYAIEEGEHSLMDWIQATNATDANRLGLLARKKWKDSYENYFLEGLELPYINLID